MTTARIDAHLHVWDLDRGDYAWLTPAAGPLHRSFSPEQAHEQLRACGIDAAVLVQAEDSEADTERMLAAADAHDWIVGVVGWVDLEQPQHADRQLDRWREHPAFCGVRALVHDDPRDDLLQLPPVRATLRALVERGLPFDVPDAWPRHLPQLAELAAALPGLRLVVDHLGKPPAAGTDGWRDWRAALTAVAAQPSVVAKASGLQVPGEPFTVAAVRPAWETALELFGPDRLMWGSDWPMTVRTAGYAGTWAVMAELLEELSAGERDRVLAGTAKAVYGLPAPAAGAAPAGRDENVLETPGQGVPPAGASV